MRMLALFPAGILLFADVSAFGQDPSGNQQKVPSVPNTFTGEQFWHGLPPLVSAAIGACLFLSASALLWFWLIKPKPSGGTLLVSVASSEDQQWLSHVMPVVRRGPPPRMIRDELIALFPQQLVILRKRRGAAVDPVFEAGAELQLSHARGMRVKRTLPLNSVTQVSIEHANWLNWVRIRFHASGKALRVRVREHELPNLTRALQLLLPGRVATGCRITYDLGVAVMAFVLLTLASVSVALALSGDVRGLVVGGATGVGVVCIPLIGSRKRRWRSDDKFKTTKDLSMRRPLRSKGLSIATRAIALAFLLGFLYERYIGNLDLGSLLASASLTVGVYFVFAHCLQIANGLAQRDPAATLRTGLFQPPILYLRSFLDDRQTTLNPGTWWSWFVGLDPPIYEIEEWKDTPLYPVIRSLVLINENYHPIRLFRLFFNRQLDSSEEQMAAFFRRYGIFVAIGKPGERFATTGALRMYVGNDEWKAIVDGLLQELWVVILQPASTEGIWWEVERSIRAVPPERLLFCMVNYHCRQNDYETFRLRLEKFLPAGVHVPRGVGCANRIMFFRFDKNWQPIALPVINYLRLLWLFRNRAVNFQRTLKPFLFTGAGAPLPSELSTPPLPAKFAATPPPLLLPKPIVPAPKQRDWRLIAVPGGAAACIAAALLLWLGFGHSNSVSPPGQPVAKPAGPPPALEVSAAEALHRGHEANEPKDYAEAMRWYRKAADQGDAGAQVSIGLLYADGHGVTQDFAQAMSWYRKAADQGNATAQVNIGVLYVSGHGVTQDFAQAMTWYRKAADQGDASAQFNIGALYASGHGVTQDFAEAMSWYRKAADQGYAKAEVSIGGAYASGHGVTQDFAQAMSWYRKAADQGNATAQVNIGVLYASGHGVTSGLRPGNDLVSQGGRPGRCQRAIQHRCTLRKRSRRDSGLRRGNELVSQSGRPGPCQRAIPYRRAIRERPGRGAGLRPGNNLVSQGGRSGLCQRAIPYRRAIRERPGRGAEFLPGAGVDG